MTTSIPRVLALWLRATPGAAPQAQEQLELEAGRGVIGDHTFGRKRHLTLIFQDEWAQACAALGREVDPAGRRANVLLSGRGSLDLIGCRVRIGEVELRIEGETRPCATMERAAVGLMAALEPAGRAGVWGRALKGGRLRIDQALEVLAPEASMHEPGQ